MEEVDNIIIATLRDIGCNYGDATSLHQFSAENMVESCVRCLRLINPDFNSPTVMPEAMSARYRMCTTLANTVQALGYQAEVGYQTFLYSSVKDWRKLLMFLLEKLPKDSSQAVDEPLGSSVLLGRRIAAELSQCLSSPWTPHFTKSKGTAWSGTSFWREDSQGIHPFRACDVQAPKDTTNLNIRVPKEVKQYYSQQLPFVCVQPRTREDLAPSVMERNGAEFAEQQEWEAEWNQQGLASRLSEEDYKARKKQRLQKRLADHVRASLQQAQSTSSGFGSGADLMSIISSFSEKASTYHGTGSRFQHAERLQFAKEDDSSVLVEEASEEELQRRREEELASLQDQLADLTSQLESLELAMRKYTAAMGQMSELQLKRGKENQEEEEAYRVKKRTFDLLPNADENIVKLQELIQSSADRLAKLAAKWEEVRGPLVERYRTLKADSENRESETSLLLAEMKLMRGRMKEVADETRLKDELYKQLVGEYERMSKDVNRGSYTRRIMEIVMNIQRQKEDISKILADTRLVQKEINQLSGKLDRIFTVTDEQMFKDVRKDEARRASYKLLASFRDKCDEVIEAIKETGQIKREQRDLEEQIENESGKKVAANLKRINADFDQVKKENAQLSAQLKS